MFRKILAAVAFLSIAAVGAAPAEAHRHHDGYYDRGYDHRYDYRNRDHRCRNSGTGGAIIGAVGGGLLGNSIAGHGDKTLGTVIGAGGGALVGNAIGRSGHHDC